MLTLTATPIPRTLHMALPGARDMSTINTPPRDRRPIHTEIVEFDDEVIAYALLREADRGGQSFFVHNRVESIDAIANYVRAARAPPADRGRARPDARAPARGRDAQASSSASSTCWSRR